MAGPTETTVLVDKQDKEGKQERNATGCAACIKKSVSCMMSKWSLFYVFCFLSGQYINFEILNNRSPLAVFMQKDLLGHCIDSIYSGKL